MLRVRQTVRSLLRTSAFAVTAGLTIALAIGANVAVYAIVHAVLLQPLPFREPDRLVEIWETHPELRNLEVAVPDYLDWKRSFKTLDTAAYTFQAMDKVTLLGRGKPIAVQGTNASSELFPLLGIQPILGRLYDATDEREKHPVVLISESLWHGSFSSDLRVIGRSLQLGQRAFTVVGVLPQKSSFPSWADVWVPLSLTDKYLLFGTKYHPLEVISRVKPGVALPTAEAEVEKVARQLSSAYPVTNGKIGARRDSSAGSGNRRSKTGANGRLHRGRAVAAYGLCEPGAPDDEPRADATS